MKSKIDMIKSVQKLIVRPYQSSDVDDLLTAWEQATRLAHPFFTDAFVAQERVNTRKIYLPNADTWVAKIDGKVIGFIALIGNEVGGLFLDPSYHRKGIGKALMNKAQDLHGKLVVDVFKDNIIGCQFYADYGFTVVTEKRHEQTKHVYLKMAYVPSCL